MTELSEVRAMANDFRQMWESILLSSVSTSDTTGSCLYASMLLASSIDKFTNATAQVRGGGGGMDGGLRDKSGTLRGHYWVEGTTDGGQAFAVDITADQFGYDKVVLLPLAEARSRYIPGDQDLINQHVKEEMALCMQAGKLD